MLMSVWARTAVEATLSSYFLGIGYVSACGCMLGPVWGPGVGMMAVVGVGATINLVVSALCVAVAVRELRVRAVPWYRPPPLPDPFPRPPRLETTRRGRPPRRELPPLVLPVDDPPLVTPAAPERSPLATPAEQLHPLLRPRPRPVVADDVFPRPVKPPVDEDRPLLWKELYFHAVTRDLGPAPAGFWPAAVVVGGAVLGLFWFIAMLEPGSGVEMMQSFNFLVRFLTVVLAGAVGLGVIAHTAGSVTRERERDTLVALLTIPDDRAAILEAKWLAGFLGLRGLLTCLGVVWLCGILTGGLHPVSAVWLAVAVAGPLEFLASLGLWLSVVCGTTLRANLAAALLLLLVAAGPWVVSNYIELLSPYRSAGPDDLVTAGLMPPVAWVRAAVTWGEYAKYPEELRRAILLGALAYAVCAWGLWKAACRRFGYERLGKGK
jgi:hypothetical protein